eukprot:CAMPEP_0206492912 /NCGR_PEP_ID=MMETSP0324_2-20121206/46502_1 /ASSEMBLY_ACC=CAM_ASM_000836 /TAXON_ID=2866 /ORGANISM="Crypthecodinium cohnii, Strain Seligo" /LENGTH=65 /DNA_ID=CAMNT_0053975641 /DNA_START=219 /DNA_END=412 /DNA_ORIENTATION=+
MIGKEAAEELQQTINTKQNGQPVAAIFQRSETGSSDSQGPLQEVLLTSGDSNVARGQNVLPFSQA